MMNNMELQMETIDSLVKKRDARGIAAFIESNGLALNESNRMTAVSSQTKTRCKRQQDFYDQRQLIKKILLNS